MITLIVNLITLKDHFGESKWEFNNVISTGVPIIVPVIIEKSKAQMFNIQIAAAKN